MNIPTFVKIQFVQEDGFLTPEMQNYNDELNQALQNGLSDSGWTTPQLTTAQITQAATFMPNGTLWYATDAIPQCYVGKINGSLVKFTTTPFP